jgi:hypothetical protein
MFFKNLVDRYLIYHVYIPSKINYKMHAKAILFVKISYVFLLLQVYINLNGRDNPWPSVLVLAVLLFHTLYIFFHFWGIYFTST